MSRVTNIIIICSSWNEKEIIDPINVKIRALHEYGALQRIDQHAEGGSKAMEISVYAGAFNYFRNVEVEEFMRQRKWDKPFIYINKQEEFDISIERFGVFEY